MGEKFDALTETLQEEVRLLATAYGVMDNTLPHHQPGLSEAERTKGFSAFMGEMTERIAGDLDAHATALENMRRMSADYEAVKSGERELHPNSRAWSHPDILEDLGISPDGRPKQGGRSGGGMGRSGSRGR